MVIAADCLFRITTFLFDIFAHITSFVESIYLGFFYQGSCSGIAEYAFLMATSNLYFFTSFITNRIGRKKSNGKLLPSSSNWKFLHFVIGFATFVVHFAAYYVILEGKYFKPSHIERLVAWSSCAIMSIISFGNSVYDSLP